MSHPATPSLGRGPDELVFITLRCVYTLLKWLTSITSKLTHKSARTSLVAAVCVKLFMTPLCVGRLYMTCLLQHCVPPRFHGVDWITKQETRTNMGLPATMYDHLCQMTPISISAFSEHRLSFCITSTPEAFRVKSINSLPA